MKSLLVILIGILLVGGVVLFAQYKKSPNAQSDHTQNTPQTSQAQNYPATTVIASHLDVPWAIAFLPDGRMLVTERPGRVDIIDKHGNIKQIATVPVYHANDTEGGLLGITRHPNFS